MEGAKLQRIPLRENFTGQGLILTSLAMIALGVVMVFSASHAGSAAAPSADWLGALAKHDYATAAAGLGESLKYWLGRHDVRQAAFAIGAMIVLFSFWKLDYHWFARRLGRLPSPATILLILGIAGALAALALSHGHRQAGRGLGKGLFTFQPWEIIKFASLACLAAFLSRPKVNPRSVRTYLACLAFIGAVCGLVVTQDFDTAVLIGVTAMAILLMAGVPWHYLAPIVLVVAIGFTAMILKDPYHAGRITAWFHPDDLANKSAYQPFQARLAIGAGAAPAGLGGGVSRYGYLPEDDTDSIFAVICEELGIVGAVLVIGLLLAWLWLSRRAVARAPDRFGALLAGGLGFIVVTQAALHIAVAVGWAPSTGTALSFISRGGSSLLGISIATAIIVSVTSRRAPAEAAGPEGELRSA